MLKKNAGLASEDCAVASTSDTHVAVSNADHAMQQVSECASPG